MREKALVSKLKMQCEKEGWRW